MKIILGLVAFVLGKIFLNFLCREIWDKLPGLAYWTVKKAADNMPEGQREDVLAQWLGDIYHIKGNVHKVWNATLIYLNANSIRVELLKLPNEPKLNVEVEHESQDQVPDDSKRVDEEELLEYPRVTKKPKKSDRIKRTRRKLKRNEAPNRRILWSVYTDPKKVNTPPSPRDQSPPSNDSD